VLTEETAVLPMETQCIPAISCIWSDDHIGMLSLIVPSFSFIGTEAGHRKCNCPAAAKHTRRPLEGSGTIPEAKELENSRSPSALPFRRVPYPDAAGPNE